MKVDGFGTAFETNLDAMSSNGKSVARLNEEGQQPVLSKQLSQLDMALTTMEKALKDMEYVLDTVRLVLFGHQEDDKEGADQDS